MARGARVIAPEGAGRLLRRIGFAQVDEVVPGDRVAIGDAAVTALAAVHDARRRPLGATVATLGYDIAGAHRIYFAGDTELFDGMRDLAGRFDVALLPVWGWGPSLGPGHMDPLSAAQAVALVRPAIAVPIHWGTFFPVGLEALRGSALVEPPRVFARHVAQLAPEVDVRVLAPGDELRSVESRRESGRRRTGRRALPLRSGPPAHACGGDLRAGRPRRQRRADARAPRLPGRRCSSRC